MFTRVDERCYCFIIPRLRRVDITAAAAAGKEKTPTNTATQRKTEGQKREDSGREEKALREEKYTLFENRRLVLWVL